MKRSIRNACLLACLASPPALAADLIGQASVIDGDTIEIQGQRIRLWGIDAPESSQLCRGPGSLHYRCGAVSANGLSAFVGVRPVTCAPRDIDRYGRTVAACTVAGVDLGGWLVSSGLAIDLARYSRGAYARDQTAAQKASVGIWAGSFVEPQAYRGCVRSGGSLAVCSDGS